VRNFAYNTSGKPLGRFRRTHVESLDHGQEASGRLRAAVGGDRVIRCRNAQPDDEATLMMTRRTTISSLTRPAARACWTASWSRTARITTTTRRTRIKEGIFNDFCTIVRKTNQKKKHFNIEIVPFIVRPVFDGQIVKSKLAKFGGWSRRRVPTRPA
jgi:hypothetical protein